MPWAHESSPQGSENGILDRCSASRLLDKVSCTRGSGELYNLQVSWPHPSHCISLSLHDVQRSVREDFFVRTFKFLNTAWLGAKSTVGTQKLHFAKGNTSRQRKLIMPEIPRQSALP